MAQIILDSNNNLIQGDFDNATLNNRTKLQTTTTNATTNVYVVPNGSSTSAGVSVANNSSLTNASKIVMATNGTTDTQIISGVNGSGTYLPLSFYTNNTLAMQITTAGNIVVASTAAPAFSAYLSATMGSISSGVDTKITYQTEEFDTGGCFNNTASTVTLNGISTPSYSFAPNVAGYYQINAIFRADNSPTRQIVYLYKNGAYLKTGNDITGSAGVTLVLSCLVYANGTSDTFAIYGYATGSPTVASTANTFSAAMVRSV
jgi:hypothetical protein